MRVRRSPRVLLAWFAAVVMALTTARVVGGDLATLHRRAASLGPQQTVIVAARDLALGQTITSRDIRRESRYRSQTPRAAIRSAAGAVGRVVMVPVLRGGMLFAGHLAPAERTGLDAVVPLGKRAVHITPKDGFRPPRGSVVGVLAVDDASTSGESDGAYAGVTVLVTESEARAIAFAAATADLTLAVTPPE